MRALVLLLLLVGCAQPVPVARKFPSVPDIMKTKCVQLNQLPEETKLSDVAKNISSNYALYHECSLKVESWVEWYDEQKKIFDEVK